MHQILTTSPNFQNKTFATFKPQPENPLTKMKTPLIVWTALASAFAPEYGHIPLFQTKQIMMSFRVSTIPMVGVINPCICTIFQRIIMIQSVTIPNNITWNIITGTGTIFIMESMNILKNHLI